MPEPDFGTAGADHLGLGARQQEAIGRVEPDLEDEATRDLLFCTGTMVASGWVLTAAHCSVPAGRPLRFVVGHDPKQPLATWRSRRLYRHAELDLLLLELDVSASEVDALVLPVPIASSFVLELGETVELAGFGVTKGEDSRKRHFFAEPLVELDATSLTVDGFGRSGACTGDSGGPLLARDTDGSARVFGVLHGGSPDCAGRDVYTRVTATDPLVSARLGRGCATF